MKKMILGGKSIITGNGALQSLKDVKAAKAFIVTGGQSMFKNGTIAQIEDILHKQNCETYVYSGISKNPDTIAVLQGLEKMRVFNPEILIAVGGGSPIDAAKVMALFFDYPEINFDNVLSFIELPEERRKIQLIAIPSTSGTGTEVTKAAVITFKEKNLKIGIRAGAMVPDLAILDANITMSMPANVVAETGMDAMTHAVECYINKNIDDFSEVLALGAIAGLFRYLPASYCENTLESREKVHHFQCMAGLAFANVGLGMVHGIAHAFGGKYNLGHGLLNAVALPYVMQYNSQDKAVQVKLQRLAQIVGRESFVEAIKEMNDILNIPKSFKELGISEQQFEDDFAELVQNSLLGSTRVNPVKITRKDMGPLLENIYQGIR